MDNREYLEEDKNLKSEEHHLRMARKHKSAANVASSREMKAGLMKAAQYEEKLAAQAAKKEASVNENYYAPRNVVAGGKPSLGDSTDDTVYNLRNRLDRIYQPSKQDAMPPEHDQKVKVPASVIAVLTSRAKDAREYSKKLNVTQTEDRQFYADLANMFDDLCGYLKSGTVHDMKMASTYLTSLMGPMLYEVPTEVVRFIAYGGTHAPLKSFVNSITAPNGGINVSGELDKL